MNEWQVVGVIMALVGLASAIVAPIIKLNTSITKLTVLLDGLKSNQDSYEQRNREAHKCIWEHNGEQDEMLQKHETDIQLLKDGRKT